jgi:hypothetical protein
VDQRLHLLSTPFDPMRDETGTGMKIANRREPFRKTANRIGNRAKRVFGVVSCCLNVRSGSITANYV